MTPSPTLKGGANVGYKERLLMHWLIPCTKSSGVPRKQFLQWAIPKSVRDELGIRDGDRHSILVSHMQWNETLTLTVTSGGELQLPTRVAQILQRQAKEFTDSSVQFEILIEDELQAASDAFERQVEASQRLTPAARRARLEKAPRQPQKRKIETEVFIRNPDVVAEVLGRAAGCCERCKNSAPFVRRSDGTPYLEVHHKVQLARGGDDIVENAEAVCPNCHRKSHHGHLDA